VSRKFQKAEINTFCYASVYCPFCGTQVVDGREDAAEGDEAIRTNPCDHTLFIACDMDLTRVSAS
jgi:hypothetical protein